MTRETSNEKIRPQHPEDTRFPGLLVENSPEGMIICDKKNRILLANPEFCRLFGYSRKEVLGCPVHHVVCRSSGIRRKVKALSAKALENTRILPEFILERKDGSAVSVSLTMGPFKENGDIAGTYGIYRDLSRITDAEGRLRREKVFFESLFHNSPGAIIICDRNERIVRVNREFCRLFGYTEDEVRGKDGNSVVANRPDLYKEAQKLDEDMWSTGKRVSLDTVRTKKDGSTIPVSIIQVPFSLEDGTMYDYSIYTDITERRKAETASKREKSFFEKLFEASPEAIMVCDRSCRIKRVNPAFCNLFDYREDEVIGREAWKIVAQDPEIITEAREYDRIFWAGQKIDMEVVRQRKDGKGLHLALTQVPIDIEEEGVLCYVIYRDISERVRAEQEIRRHLHFEKLVSILSSLFLTSGVSRETLQTSLSEAGNSLGATHGWIVLCGPDGGEASVEASWCVSESEAPLPEKLPPGTHFRWSMSQVLDKKVSLIPNVDEATLPDAPETAFLNNSGITSCLMTALSIDDLTMGFVLFGKTAKEASWDKMDLSALQIYANILDQAFRRSKAEESLRISEERARRIFQEQNDFLLRFTPDMVVTFANSAYCRFIGKSPEEIIGVPLGSFMINKTEEEFRRTLRALTPQNPLLKSQEIYHMPSGEQRWVQWIDRGIYDRDGRLVEIQSEGRDITELKLTEEALEKSEKRYQAIVNDQVEMVGRFRPDGTLIFANPALAANLSLPGEGLEGKNLFDVLPDEVALPLAEDLKTLSPANPCIFREQEYKTPSGGTRWERWSYLGIFNERGELVEIQGVGRDLTELKRSRDALEHLNAVLKSIRGINRLINKQKNKRRLVQGICAHLIETRGYGNVWVALLEKHGNLATVTEAGINEQGRPMAETLEHEELNEWGRNVLKTPGVIVSRHASPRSDCPLLDNFSEKAIMTTRLEHGGTVYGLISVSLPEGFTADGEERTLFLEVARDIAFALHAIDADKDREKAVQELREKAREIEMLIKDRPEGLWAWDMESDRIFFNENCEKNLGYQPGELLQPTRSRWEQSIHPDDVERVKAVLGSYLENPEKGDVFEVEYRIKTKQGEWKWVTDRARIVERDENGKALRISGTQTDGEMAYFGAPLGEVCRTLLDALCRENSRGVILHWDTDAPDPGRIFAADRAACRLTGFSANELTGGKITDLLERNGKPLPLKRETFRFRLLGRGAAATFLSMQKQPEGQVFSNKTD